MVSKKDAEKFIEVLKTADGGCQYCVKNLLKNFIKKFPQNKEIAREQIQKIKEELNKGDENEINSK